MFMVRTLYHNLDEFPFWGGAVSNFAKLTEGEKAQLENLLDDYEENGVFLTETELNDMMWFDIADRLGIDDEEWEARF